MAIVNNTRAAAGGKDHKAEKIWKKEKQYNNRFGIP